jgi:hypothetical protein
MNMKNTARRAAKKERPVFEPTFSDEQVNTFEANYNETWGVNRRLTMITLSRSSGQLIEGFASLITENNGDAFVSLIDQIKDYRQHLEDMTRLADTAAARLILVGQYIAEGEKA